MKNSESSIEAGIPIRSHWIVEIASGRKDWELRSRAWHGRSTIGLIESGTGSVVGIADIVGCHGPLSFRELMATRDRHQVSEEMLRRSSYKKTYAYEIQNVRWFDAPVPYTHKSGAVTSVRFDQKDRCALDVARATSHPVRRRAGHMPKALLARPGKSPGRRQP